MKRLESELDNIAWMTYSVKEDSVGLDMWYEWITSVYLDRHCTGRFRGSRGVQVVLVQTGGAPLARTCQGWESPGRKQRWQLKTDQNGVKCGPMHPLWWRSRSINHFICHRLTVHWTKYNNVKTLNRHGNGLPEKPTAHQAGRQCNKKPSCR